MDTAVNVVLVALASLGAIIAIGGHTWVDGPHRWHQRVTRRGYAALLVFSMALVLGIVRELQSPGRAADIEKKHQLELTELNRKLDDAYRMGRWGAVTISELTVGLCLDPDEVRGLQAVDAIHPIRLRLILDRDLSIEVPPVKELTYRDWSLFESHADEGRELRVSIGDQTSSFPATLGDLVGHELKIREDEPRPTHNIIRSIRFYHERNAKKPFLVMEDTTDEHDGRYPLRVWYPRARVETNPGSGRSRRPFLVTPTLLFPHDPVLSVEQSESPVQIVRRPTR